MHYGPSPAPFFAQSLAQILVKFHELQYGRIVLLYLDDFLSQRKKDEENCDLLDHLQGGLYL